MHNNNYRLISYTLGLLSLLVYFSCANNLNTGPTGGPRDTIPPAIDSTKSTPNRQVRFTERKIELVFDEWIQAKNLLGKTLISPPLKYLPKLEARGKKITIELNEEEVLKEDATYIFNLGDAVADFRENNKIENLSFVFSTGDEIDSLGFSGTLVDGKTGDPVPDVYIMMYDIISDSILYKEKPFYFVNTDKNGAFTFQNIREDTFSLFALKDGNLNYTYDPGIEAMAFYDSIIILNDSTLLDPKLRLFQENRENKFSKLLTQIGGQVKLLFKEELDLIPTYTTDPEMNFIFQEINKDTLTLWVSDTSLFNLYIDDDTIEVAPKIPIGIKNNLTRYNKTQILSPIDTLTLTSNFPLNNIVTDSINIKDTSGVSLDFSTIIKDKKLFIIGKWKADSMYTVMLLPGSMVDIYNGINDTATINVTAAPKTKYGDIFLDILGMDTTFDYIVNLNKGKNSIRANTVSQMDSVQLIFNTITPGDYGIEILEDKNRNGRWDPGNYLKRLQPEIIKSLKLESLRENWELNARFDWSEKLKQ